MKRSRELYKRSRKTVIAIVLIHIAVPVFVNAVAGLLLVAIAKALYPANALHGHHRPTAGPTPDHYPVQFPRFRRHCPALLETTSGRG
jgi:hypothetical protein